MRFKGAKGNKYNMGDLKPFFEVAEADGGLFVGARRTADDELYYWRITPWVMPAFTLVPPRGDHPVHGHFWVPIDDENCWVYTFDYHPVRALTPEERQAMMDGFGVHSENIPGTYRPVQNKDNDYQMDREAQRRGEHYSGIRGIAIQDASLQESLGPIVGGFGGGPWLDGRMRMANAAIGYPASGLDDPPDTYANVARISFDAITAYASDVRGARQVKGR
jgi:phthalate 4,5-dioxygenase oxygenase subunit